MSDSKSNPNKKGTSLNGQKKAKKSGTNYQTDFPPLKNGPNNNFHTFVKNLSREAMFLYGDLARIFEDDKYYVPVINMPTADEKSPSDQDSGDQSEETKSSSSDARNTRGRASRRDQTTEDYLPLPADISQLPKSLQEAYLSELVKEKAKIEHKMIHDRPSLYAYMIKHITRESLDDIKKDVKYPDFNRKKDPLELWLAIKRTHRIGSDTKNVVETRANAREKFMSVTQAKEEYITMFKERYDHLLDAYKAAGNPELPQEDVAIHFMRALNEKYKDMKDFIRNGAATGQGEMPKSLSDMYEIACTFKLKKKDSISNHGTAFATSGDKGGGGKQDKQSKSSTQGRKDGSNDSSDSKGNSNSNSNVANSSGKRQLICWQCKEPGHKLQDCPHVGKKESNAEHESYHTKCVFAVPDNGSKHEWYEVLLDNQSNVSILDKRLLKNVRDSDLPYHINGMGPTPLILDKVGYLEQFFECVAGSDLKANILCMAQVEDLYHVTYKQGESFTVHLPERDWIVSRRGCMYVGDMRDWAEESRTAMVTTAAENESRYTKPEIKNARKVRGLLRSLGYPSQEEAIRIINSGAITKIPFTVQDIKRSYEIYGPPTEYVRGKKTAKKVSRQPIDFALRDGYFKEQKMYGDIMYVKKKGFLISLSEPLGILMTTFVKDTFVETLSFALHEQVNTLRSRSFDPKIVYLDDQPGFHALENAIPGVVVDIGGAGDHLSKADAKIRRLKEMIRCVHAGLPWKLPNMLVKDLVKFCTRRMNLSQSSSNNVNEPPLVALQGYPVSYEKELKVAFGDYCEVYRPNVTSNDALQDRTVPCVALWPTGNANGSWVMFNTLTNSRLRTTNFTSMVTTDQFIRKMNDLAEFESDQTDADLFETPGEEQQNSPVENEIKDPYRPILTETNDSQDSVVDELTDDEVVVENTPQEIKFGNFGESSDYGIEEQNSVNTNANSEVEDSVEDEVSVNQVTVVGDPTDTKDCSTGVLQHDVMHTRGKIAAMEYVALHTTVQKGLEKYGSRAYAAVMDELKQLVVLKKSMHPVHRSELSVQQSKRIIRSFMFLKAKFDALGRFDKIKARLVANGAQQDRTLYDNVSSPTAKMTSVMMVLTIAAAEDRVITAVDIGGAYLNADMTGEDVIMELDPLLTKLLKKISPEVIPFIDEKGKLLMKLDKALYGCIQSAKLWYETLSAYLRSIGFEHNGVDQCVMNKVTEEGQITIIIYVDDILISAKEMSQINKFIDQLKKEYLEVKVSEPGNFSYLGMHISKSKGCVKVSMKSFVEGLLKEMKVSGTVTSPATSDLFKIGDTPKLSAESAKLFHTVVAKLLYLAKRPDSTILLPVSFLTTRVKEPTENDQKKLMRVLKYLNGTGGRDLFLQPENSLNVIGYIDAAFALHADGKSHTGMVVTVGGASILCESGKQKNGN